LSSAVVAASSWEATIDEIANQTRLGRC
jgi:hypothetical protein